MNRYYMLTLLITLVSLSLNALELVGTDGLRRDYNNADLHKMEKHELKTSREKDGVVRLNNWLGFRFDVWLRQQEMGKFNSIRFESDDKYTVTLSRAEFDAVESWIVLAQDEVPFEDNSLRLIFPTLREMQWIRNLKRVVLEDFLPLPQPAKFVLMQPFLDKQKLYTDPTPFVNMQGWFFNDIFPQLSETEECQVILYSRDGLKQNLSFPYHLDGAVLEKSEDGSINLKSPQIPGGMWLRDIIYLQINNTALIDERSISSLINLHKVLQWEITPELNFYIHKADEELELGFADALAEPQVFKGALFFELR